MAQKMKIPGIVKELRNRAGMTQAQLDEAASLPVGTASKVERGVIDLKSTYLLRIIEVTGHEFVIRRTSGNE